MYEKVVLVPKSCEHCNKAFTPTRRQSQKYCSRACNSAAHEVREHQEDPLGFYFKNLLKCGKLSTRKTRKQLSVEFLKNLYKEQDGKCALSGLEMTHLSFVGRVSTNISVDRKIPGGSYTPDNVQLVRSAVNSWRGDLSLEEFIETCRCVYLHSHNSILRDVGSSSGKASR